MTLPDLKRIVVCFTFLQIILFTPTITTAQSVYQPYSYDFYQKLNNVQYSWDTRLHTSVKPIVLDSVLLPAYESVVNQGYQERNTWAGRKIWNEHLIEVNNDEYTFYADFIPDFQIGRDFAGDGKTVWLNTRGFQLGGSIHDKFFFHTSGYENQAVFPSYINDYILENRVVPGQMYGKLGTDQQDWAYVSAVVSYSPKKHLNFSLAYDKNFIGDGYRSMLLSDVSSNHTFLKFNGIFGNVSYTSILSYMLDPNERISDETSRSRSRRKWGAFQYIDWNLSNRLSLGVFHSVLWGNAKSRMSDDSGFFPESPVLFPDETSADGMDAAMQIGLNGKYKLLRNAAIYGQLLLNNEVAAQLGVRGFDAFGVKRLNFLGEFNMARPYAYATENSLVNYSNYSQPLAHPFGGNFREFVGLLNYNFRRFDFALQGNYGHYGLDSEGLPGNKLNYGKDISRPFDKELEITEGTGQGLATDLLYLNGRVAYILNPKYNLRFEAGATVRREINDEWTKNTLMLQIGLRASFRNLYYDF